MNETYIYGIRDLDIQKFVYIGKSNTPLDRFKGHVKGSTSLCLRKLIREKGADSFGLIVLERTSFSWPRGWVRRERFWIKKFRKEGHPLCNRNDGGGGLTEHAEETRVKMSKPKSKEHKQHLSEARKGIEPWNKGIGQRFYCIDCGKEVSRGSVRCRGCYDTNRHVEYICIDCGKMTTKGYARCRQCNSVHIKNNAYNGKTYPTLYNRKTRTYIPSGKNIKGLCRKYHLSYNAIFHLITGDTKCTKDGWQIATKW